MEIIKELLAGQGFERGISKENLVPCKNFTPPLSIQEIDRILTNFQLLIKSLPNLT